MLKKAFTVASVLFLPTALMSGCFGETSTPVVHETKLFVPFTGNTSLGTKPDPQPGEEVDVTVDGTLEGTATAAQQFYEVIDTGTHTIMTKSHIVNSTYMTTHTFASGEQFSFDFNCGDAHVTFNADAAWAVEGVTKLQIAYRNANPPPVTSAFSITVVPGEQADSVVDVQAGSRIAIADQNGKFLKYDTLNVPYDARTSFTITYP